MTPADAIKTFFDHNAMLLMFAWGLLCTRLPQLKNIPNVTIPYVNTAIYVLTRLATGTAFAACANCPPDQVPAVATVTAASLVGMGGMTAVFQALLYDKFVKPILARWFLKVV